MKIFDVGAGFYKYPGSVSIDGNSNANPDILHDLNSCPWPVNDSEFDFIYSSHCLEHLNNTRKIIEEIWRVGRNGAIVIIKVPHFSSRVAWTDIEHTRAFTINILRGFTGQFSKLSNSKAKFEVIKTKLNWQQRFDIEFLPKWILPLMPLINVVNTVISALANLNPVFCERIWCYYVGGMGEIEIKARIIK